eukprot:gene8253-9135_t
MSDSASEEEYVTCSTYINPMMCEYEGERSEMGERHGKGTAIYENGDRYVGDYQHGKRHGEGVYYFLKAVYKGQFKDGKRDGVGSMVYPDGSKYDGEWKNGKKHGKGVYYFANGDEWEGTWQNDEKHGICTYTYAETGSKFSAKWVDGTQNGMGEWIHFNHRYKGWFRDCMPIGHGKYIFNNSSCEQYGYYTVMDIVQQVDKRMELVGREPAWFPKMIKFSLANCV